MADLYRFTQMGTGRSALATPEKRPAPFQFRIDGMRPIYNFKAQ